MTLEDLIKFHRAELSRLFAPLRGTSKFSTIAVMY